MDLNSASSIASRWGHHRRRQTPPRAPKAPIRARRRERIAFLGAIIERLVDQPPVEQQAYLLARLRDVAGQQAPKIPRRSLHVLDDRLGGQPLPDDGLAFADPPMHIAGGPPRSFNRTRGNNG